MSPVSLVAATCQDLAKGDVRDGRFFKGGTVDSPPQAAIRKHLKLGASDSRTVLSHSAGGQKSQIRGGRAVPSFLFFFFLKMYLFI